MRPIQIIVRESHGRFDRLTAYFVGNTHTWEGEWDRYSPGAIRLVMEYYRRHPVLYPMLKRRLPRDGECVEAGSGLGFWVELLNQAGIRAHGLDCSALALARAREAFPHLRFEGGDVLALPFRDGSLAGYVSFGVAEHFRQGPEGMLREAARVLRRKGVMVLAVPWLSPLRRLQPFRPSAPPADAKFYQYFFTREEIRALLGSCRFRPLAFSSYATLKTIRDEIRAIGRAWTVPPQPESAAGSGRAFPADAHRAQARGSLSVAVSRRLFWRAQNLILENLVCRRFAGHMLLVAAERV